MGPKEDPAVTGLKKEIESLKQTLKSAQDAANDSTLENVCSGLNEVPRLRLQTKRLLKGHIHKVNSVHFSGDSRHCVSGSLDGKLIIWDTWTGNKVQIIPLRSSWVMTTAFSQSGNFVASGGMDNMATVYDLNNRDSSGVAKVTRELAGYDGFLSCCRFVSDQKLVTGSGDMKICLWDLTSGKRIGEWFGHAGDVVSMSLKPDDSENVFVTGSVDQSAKLWDLREKAAVQTFWGHSADVNSVCFHPSSVAFCSASEDKTARLFDLRSDQQVAQYVNPGGGGGGSVENSTGGFTSSGLSKSGRYLFAGCDDSNIHMWDLLKGCHTGTLGGHENRVTSISVADNGIALASCSWDQNIRIWVC
ncbi:Guanine nucleotide-binding protein subunit beta-2 [Orchesella cincta]|uniref:Guanine nucleotide-binding protein subunit beta-2 n=1 Tax=Orchesella cincta TaxID=48709 RepID=A0A1D2MB35_ORCCI|nr:Guanine nucleotide-binding protein subunit beta-2 [Orchesella cincta]